VRNPADCFDRIGESEQADTNTIAEAEVDETFAC